VSTALANVKVYDLVGRFILEKSKVNANETSIDVSRLASQVLIVKITGANNAIVDEKYLTKMKIC
jgi:hypothetical protein